MLTRVNPQLFQIEALTEPGCYSLTFALDSGEQRALVMRVRGEEAIAPAANALPGWAPGTGVFDATLEAVKAFHQARELAGPTVAGLSDIDGGWDVGLGNVVLADGAPTCVVHGALESSEPDVYRCPVCGAAARYPG